MPAYWCELAWLGGVTATADVLLRVDGGVLSEVTPGVACPAGAVRLVGLTLPGMANTHSHAFHRALRGRTQVGVGSFWTWRDQMYTAALGLNPENYQRLARAVFGEMALAGITCVGEFHYLHHGLRGTPYSDPNEMGAALVSAAAEAGVRITLLDTCYLQGGFGRSLDEAQQRFADGDAEAWGARAAATRSLASPVARLGAAIHSVRAVPPAAIRVVASWADEDESPLHAHVSEQPTENEQCIEAHGLTPTGLLDECGALREQFTAVHATHLAVSDIELYGSHHSTICLCPTTERDLADGIGPARALRDAGAHLAVGTDSHAMIDLFEETRAVELNERLVTQVRGRHDTTSLLHAATEHGYQALGWHDGGRLVAGALADFVTIRLDSVRTAGSTPQTSLAVAVFAAAACDVHHVVVDGRVVVSEGRHRSLDVAAELQASITDLMAT